MSINLFVLLLVSSGSLFVDAKTKEANKINEHLIEKCNTDEFGANLAAAKEFLAECQQKTSDPLIKGLETFISLEQIENGSQQCNEESYNILMANDALVGGDLHKKAEQSSVESLTRLESLVYSVMSKHAETCPEVYGQKFNQARESSADDAAIIKKAQDATRRARSLLTVADKHIEQSYAKLLHLDLVRLAQQANDPDAKFAFTVIDPETGVGSIDNAKLESLMEKYIRQPCQDFVNKFGDDLFKPAGFDARLQGSLIRIFLKDSDTYYTCSNINEDQLYKNVVNSMLKLMSDPELAAKYKLASKPHRKI